VGDSRSPVHSITLENDRTTTFIITADVFTSIEIGLGAFAGEMLSPSLWWVIKGRMHTQFRAIKLVVASFVLPQSHSKRPLPF
jgi:hypothetical protein